MKKIRLLALVVLTGVSMNSQTVISNDFESGTLGWTQGFVSGNSITANSNPWSAISTTTTFSPNLGISAVNGNYTGRLITNYSHPANIHDLTSPSFTLDGTKSYVLKFKVYRENSDTSSADKISFYLSNNTTTNGTLLGTIDRLRTVAPTETANGWYTYQYDIPASTTGTKYLRLFGIIAGGAPMYIDDISISVKAATDITLTSAGYTSGTTQDYYSIGTTKTITGTFKNTGTNTITSATVTYQVGSNTPVTQNLTGLSVAAGASYTFNFTTTHAITAGNKKLTITVTQLNGAAVTNTASNSISKVVKAYSNTTTRTAFIEKHTANWCGPCRSFNDNILNPLVTDLGTDAFNYINIHSQDDYSYTAGDARLKQGDALGIPSVILDGKKYLYLNSTSSSTIASSYTYDKTEVTNQNASDAYLKVSGVKKLTAANSMELTVNITPYVSGDYNLYAYVIEKTATAFSGSNGETTHHNIAMASLDAGNGVGTPITLTDGTPFTLNLSKSLASGTKIEQFTDLEVIIVVEDRYSMHIMNSAKAIDWTLSNESFANNLGLRVYPNPSSGIVKIDNTDAVNIEVYDLRGAKVYSKANLINEALNLSDLNKGIYFMKMKNDKGEQVEKIIIE